MDVNSSKDRECAKQTQEETDKAFTFYPKGSRHWHCVHSIEFLKLLGLKAFKCFADGFNVVTKGVYNLVIYDLYDRNFIWTNL